MPYEYPDEVVYDFAPAPKPAPTPTPAPTPSPIPTPIPAPAQSTDPIISASSFIKIVRYHHLTGSEFLGLLGNSKISNKAYQEIESNPNLTVKRLIEILEESPLTSADYEKLIIAVQRSAKLKEETRAKLNAEAPAPFPAPSPAPQPTAVAYDPLPDFTAVSQPAPEIAEEKEAPVVSEEPKVIGVPMPRLFEEGEEDPDAMDGKHGRKNRKKDKNKNKDKNNNNNKDKDTDTNSDTDNDDDIQEDEERSGSNKGKFIVSVVAALLLIAFSFGLRWYFTGSWLPYSQEENPEDVLDGIGIYEKLRGLPAQSSAAHSENSSYTAGGSLKEKVLLPYLTINNRFIYYSDNTLYIFEKVGGQLDQLDVRKYDENTEILGLLKLNGGAAVVTSYSGRAYSFSYSIPSEEEGMGDTAVSGTVQRSETVIELLDSAKPENRSSIRLYAFSGSLADIWTEGDRIILATGESIPEGAAAQDAYSFMPYVCISDENGTVDKSHCAAENVLVPENSQCSSFVTVFSLDTALGTVSSAAVAGGSGQLVSKSGNNLFVGQKDLLVRYDVSSGVLQNGFCALSGTVGEFSAVGVYNGEIRVTLMNEGSAALTVLDSELKTVSEVKNLGNGEAPLATCYNGNETYLMTESGTLYGIDGSSQPITESTVSVTDSRIYKWSDSVGIRLDPMGDENGRTGLLLSAVALDGSLNVLSSLEISSRTAAEQAIDEYLTSPAETDITLLGISTGDGVLVVPVVYFDGVSEVERFIVCTMTDQGNLSFMGSICEYDRQASLIFAEANDGIITAVTGDRLITARVADGSIIGYFSSNPAAEVYSYYTE